MTYRTSVIDSIVFLHLHFLASLRLCVKSIRRLSDDVVHDLFGRRRGEFDDHRCRQPVVRRGRRCGERHYWAVKLRSIRRLQRRSNARRSSPNPVCRIFALRDGSRIVDADRCSESTLESRVIDAPDMLSECPLSLPVTDEDRVANGGTRALKESKFAVPVSGIQLARKRKCRSLIGRLVGHSEPKQT